MSSLLLTIIVGLLSGCFPESQDQRCSRAILGVQAVKQIKLNLKHRESWSTGNALNLFSESSPVPISARTLAIFFI